MILSPALIAVVLVAGTLIGYAGVGGVLLVPALHLIGNLPLHQAIPAAMLSYVITGLIGTWNHSLHGTLPWRMAIRLGTGAMSGAFLGAWLLSQIPVSMLSLFFGLFVLGAGISSLTKPKLPVNPTWKSGTGTLFLVGLACGIGSAFTGTGGPLLLMPILVFMGMPTLHALGLAQVIQIPIATMATAGNLLHGPIDFKLGLMLAVLLGVGAFLGGRTAHRLPVPVIEKTVAAILIATGLFLCHQTLFAT